ncbi:hypothetical protein V6N12_008410 [Hibiscus sabdariffa]|uniref:GDSL esterase/lipase n=1 Tax=Hibiscus sabdariffa TaxID=183260 RepID=A0ABR2BIR4_9ROSI
MLCAAVDGCAIPSNLYRQNQEGNKWCNSTEKLPWVVQFIFGDSMSDVGNNKYLSWSLATANLPYYGINLGNGLPNGRFTNGRTVADINGKSFKEVSEFDVLQGLVMQICRVAPWEEIDRLSHVYQLHCVQVKRTYQKVQDPWW